MKVTSAVLKPSAVKKTPSLDFCLVESDLGKDLIFLCAPVRRRTVSHLTEHESIASLHSRLPLTYRSPKRSEASWEDGRDRREVALTQRAESPGSLRSDE